MITKNTPTLDLHGEPSDIAKVLINDFIEDNRNVICNALNVNIRSGPKTSYEVITRFISKPSVQKGS